MASQIDGGLWWDSGINTEGLKKDAKVIDMTIQQLINSANANISKLKTVSIKVDKSMFVETIKEAKARQENAKAILLESRNKHELAKARLVNVKAGILEYRQEQLLNKEREKTAAKQKESLDDYIARVKKAGEKPTSNVSTQTISTGAQAAKEETVAIDNLSSAYKRQQEQKKQNAAASNDMANAVENEAQQWLFHESSLAENESRLAGYKNRLAELQIEKKAAGKSSGQLVAGESELKAKITETTKAIQLQKQEMNSAAGSVDQLKARSAILTQQYNAMSVAARSSSGGKEIQAELKATNEALAKSGVAVGDYRRKVGDYTGGIQKAFKGMWTGMRTIANLLPGLGLAGLIGILAEGLVALVKSAGMFKGSMTDLEKTQKAVNDVSLKAIDGYVEQKVQMEILTDRVKKGGKTFQEKESIVNSYNKTFGDTLGKAKSYNEVEQIIINKGADFIKAIELRSKALAALQISTEEAKKQIELQLDPSKSLTGFERGARKVWEFIKNVAADGSQAQIDATNQLKIFDLKEKQSSTQQINDSRDKQKKINNIYVETSTQAEALAKKTGINFDKAGVKAEKLAKKTFESQKNYKELLDEISQSKDKYTIDFGLNTESEQLKINKYFDDLAKKVDDFNKDPKNLIKLSPTQISNAKNQIESGRSYAIGLANDRESGDNLLKELEGQKQTYKDYEDFKAEYGEKAANTLYGNLTKKYKSYLERVQSEYNKLQDKGALNPSESVTFSKLSDLLSEAEGDAVNNKREQIRQQIQYEEDAYRKLIEETSGFYVKAKMLGNEYNAQLKALERDRTNLTESEYKNRLSIINNTYQTEISKLKIDESPIFKKLSKDITQLTKDDVASMIIEIDGIVRSGKMKNAVGEIVNIPPEILMRLDDAKNQLNGLQDSIIGIENSSSNMGRVAKVVGMVGQALSELGNGISGAGGDDVGTIVSNMGNFLQNIEVAYTKISNVVSKVNAAMKAAKQGGDAIGNVLNSNDWIGLIVSLINLIAGFFGSTKRYNEALLELQRNVADRNSDIYLSEYKISEEKRKQNLLEAEGLELTQKRLQAVKELAATQKEQIQKEYDAIFEKIQGGEFISGRSIKERSEFAKLFGGKPKEIVNYDSLAKLSVTDVTAQMKKAGLDNTVGFTNAIDLVKTMGVESLAVTDWKALLGQFNDSRLIENINALVNGGKSLKITYEELDKLDKSSLLDGETKKLFDQLKALKEQGADIDKIIEDNVKALKELATATTANSIADSIVDGFRNGKRSAQDFASDFETLMRNSMLNSLRFDEEFEASTQEWYDKFAQYATDGIIDNAEKSLLQNDYASIIEEQNKRKQLLEQASGISLSESNSTNGNSLKSSIQASLTEETGSILAGVFKGVQLSTLELVAVNKQMEGYAMRNLDYTIQIANNTYNTVSELKTAVIELKSINTSISKNADAARASGF